VVGLAGTADARNFRMSGKWLQSAANNFFLPAIGGIDATPGAMANAIGSGPATVTIPVNGFTDPVATFIIPIPNTSLVQISTRFSHFGPSQPGVMQPGTKSTRPANFAFCPGAAANLACTTPQTGGAQETKHGIVTYTVGANQFGGTMRMLAGGGGSVSSVIGTSPTRLQHNLVGNPVGIPPGAGFAQTFTIAVEGGVITTGAVCAVAPCVSATSGNLIVVPGVQTAVGTDTSNTQTIFPWTTGMVTVRVTDDLPTTSGTFTGTGSDNRTPLGAGNLTLVSGGLLQQNPNGNSSAESATVTMTFRPQNLPSMTPPGLAALGALLIVGVGYAHRRRLQ
jgi:hypothetical protein